MFPRRISELGHFQHQPPAPLLPHHPRAGRAVPAGRPRGLGQAAAPGRLPRGALCLGDGREEPQPDAGREKDLGSRNQMAFAKMRTADSFYHGKVQGITNFLQFFLCLLRYAHPPQWCQSSSSSVCPCRCLSSWMCCTSPAAAGRLLGTTHCGAWDLGLVRAVHPQKSPRMPGLVQAVHPKKSPGMLGLIRAVHPQKSPGMAGLLRAVHPQKAPAGIRSSAPAGPVLLRKLLPFFPSNTFKGINMHMRSRKMSHISVSSNY